MERIAVTGASGKVGGAVVDLLASREDCEVIAVTRRRQPERRLPPTADWSPPADYSDRAALQAALPGVDTLVMVSSDGESALVLAHHQNLIEAAVGAGVSHVVALSSLDADLRSPFCYAVTNALTEQMLRDAGVGFSIARASIFTEFFLQWPYEALDSGEIRLPASDGRISLVSRTDVARSLAALAVAPPTGGAHDITGDESLDLFAIADLTATKFARPVEYIDVTPRDHRLDMARADLDPWWAYAYTTMFQSIRQHRWDRVSREVQALTGRTPTHLSELL